MKLVAVKIYLERLVAFDGEQCDPAGMEQGAPESASAESPILGWLVHLLTATGAVLAFLALLAIEDRDWRLALLWLAAALAIDSVDGTLARRLRVKARVPGIDGDTLDLIVDYLNYVFVPTVLIWRAGTGPGRTGAAAGGPDPDFRALRFRQDRPEDRGQLLPRLPRPVERRRLLSLRHPARSAGRGDRRLRVRGADLRAGPFRPPVPGQGLWRLAAGAGDRLGRRHRGPAVAGLERDALAPSGWPPRPVTAPSLASASRTLRAGIVADPLHRSARDLSAPHEATKGRPPQRPPFPTLFETEGSALGGLGLRRRGLGDRLGRARVAALGDAGRLAGAAAQIIELGAADGAAADDLDRIRRSANKAGRRARRPRRS